MKHPATDIMLAVIDGHVTSDEAKAARSHIESCAVCEGEVRRMRSVISRIREAEGLDLPAGFASDIASTVRARVDQETEWSHIEKSAERVLTGIAIVVVILLAVTTVFNDQPVNGDARTAGLIDYYIQDTTVARLVSAESITRDDVLAAALTEDQRQTP